HSRHTLGRLLVTAVSRGRGATAALFAPAAKATRIGRSEPVRSLAAATSKSVCLHTLARSVALFWWFQGPEWAQQETIINQLEAAAANHGIGHALKQRRRPAPA